MECTEQERESMCMHACVHKSDALGASDQTRSGVDGEKQRIAHSRCQTVIRARAREEEHIAGKMISPL